MNSGKIQSKFIVSSRPGKYVSNSGKTANYSANLSTNYPSSNVSFQGGFSQLEKHGWYALRRLSDQMKNVSEITNAVIAAIGTGVIAPIVILGSPGKGDEEDKNKKFFQAIRQPLSAILALLFQVPATIGVNRFINKLAYKDKIKFFDDSVIGSLIPDKKYLSNHVTKEEIAELESHFDDIVNGKSLRQELENQIRNEYQEVKLDVSNEKLAKEVKKRKTEFLTDKLVEQKRNALFDAKVEELSTKNLVIDDTDLVTKGYRKLAIQRNKAAYEAIERNANLSWFDKTLKILGFSNGKLKALEDAQEAFEKEKGLEILKTENKELFNNAKARLRMFIESHEASSQKFFGNKKFWISLLINLFMVTASCYALNWAHPRFKTLIEKIQGKKAPENTPSPSPEGEKVEVSA